MIVPGRLLFVAQQIFSSAVGARGFAVIPL
jgi:hypothetical protein